MLRFVLEGDTAFRSVQHGTARWIDRLAGGCSGSSAMRTRSGRHGVMDGIRLSAHARTRCSSSAQAAMRHCARVRAQPDGSGTRCSGRQNRSRVPACIYMMAEVSCWWAYGASSAPSAAALARPSVVGVGTGRSAWQCC